MKYFRSNSDEGYEQARFALDQALQLPTGETSIEPAASAPRDTEGNILLAIRQMHAEQEPYASAIAQALQAGIAVEITAEDYRDSQPQQDII